MEGFTPHPAKNRPCIHAGTPHVSSRYDTKSQYDTSTRAISSPYLEEAEATILKVISGLTEQGLGLVLGPAKDYCLNDGTMLACMDTLIISGATVGVLKDVGSLV